MDAPGKPPPEFTRAFLRELAGGLALRQAERLFEGGAVKEARWESPVLHGHVEAAGRSFSPALDLKSTVFVTNRCACEDGRKGRPCVHALAAALHFEAAVTPAPEPTRPPEADTASPDPEPSAGPRSITLDDDGTPLKLLVFLPPNLPQAAERHAIVVKLEAAAGREVLPLGSLDRRKPYAPAEPHRRALERIEAWCDGKLANLVQLTGPQLRELLGSLRGEPVVYRVKGPAEPIAWDGDELPGVHEHLPTDPPADAEPQSAAPRTPARAREPSRRNPRRDAEAKVNSIWDPKPGDYPAVTGSREMMAGHGDNAIVVDGSPHYLAIRLPREESVRPLRDLLKSEGFTLEISNRRWWLRDRHKTLNFLARHWRALKEEWKAEFTANFEAKLAPAELSGLHVTTEPDGEAFKLEVSLTESGDDTALRRAIATGRNYVEDDSGRITLLDGASVRKLHAIEKAVSGQADRPFTPVFSKRVATPELADVEDLLEDAVEGWQPPQAWQSRSRALRQVAALEQAPVPEPFDARLRNYQRIGVAWLWHLYRHGLGGILADEMGLGKTLQALALVACVRSGQDAPAPALVVCPASLVENWMREAARFVPGIPALRHHGTGRSREPAPLEDAGLVVTSYGTLQRDRDLLATLDWAVVIGDEAQHIKNRKTGNARALAGMRGGGRFLLTGTPVENSLDDLLSLFAFLMPGYLAKAPPALPRDDRDWHARRQLERAAPYILRRTKKEVAPELPDKIETTLFCELGASQRKFYADTLERTRREIQKLEMEGAAEGRLRFAAFTELLRLRQACVDPRILDESFDATGSAKLAAFDEVLDECLDNGGRMLVFSSFVSALKLLAEHLEQDGHPFCYLDGQTRDRLAVCDRFNNDPSIPVFLISLKAGGTGLNLTGADTVLHYDPWWNPAAEAQATDRAHRIGQRRVVTSIRLIAAGTVEEKVLELQRKKAAILEELFDESAAANARIGIEEIRELLS